MFNGEATIKLTKLLKIIQDTFKDEGNINHTLHGTMLLKIKHSSTNIFELELPCLNISEMFSNHTFLQNFRIAFNQNFPSEVKLNNFPSIMKTNVSFDDLMPYNEKLKSNLTLENTVYFRLLTCMLFNFMFDIGLNTCDCYPKNKFEYELFKMGVGFNCISLQCKNRLINNPSELDFFTHSDCSTMNIQSVNISAKINSEKVNFWSSIKQFM